MDNFSQLFNGITLDQIQGLLIILASLVGVIVLHFVLRKFLIKITSRIARKTATQWDDWLIEERFFHHLVGFIPLGLIRYFEHQIAEISSGMGSAIHMLVRLVTIWFVTHLITSVNRVFVKYVEEKGNYNIIAVSNLTQFANILIYAFGLILGISAVLRLDLNTIFTGLSAITAVVLLVFKDTLTGFVSSLQIANSKIVRIGHWVTIDQYNADGVVEKINLFNTSIRNFDKTIVTVPTSTIMQGAVKNWNSMAQSNTRRIKRSILLDVNSFRFLNADDWAHLGELTIMHDYINKRKTGGETQTDKRPTNIGAFRYYLEQYLSSRGDISPANRDTTIVRQLEMTTQGLPLQIYCFTNSSKWVEYERIQSDLFEHILTVVKIFGLQLYQLNHISSPTDK